MKSQYRQRGNRKNVHINTNYYDGEDQQYRTYSVLINLSVITIVMLCVALAAIVLIGG